MNDLFQSIYQKYASATGDDDAYSLTDGRLFRGIAKEKAARPYITMFAVGGSILGIFGAEQIEQARMQFTVVDDFRGDASTAGKIWESIVRVFERQTLVLLGGTHIVMRRDGLPREIIDMDVVEITGDFRLEQQTS